jgi:tetratricopeptide (TPR) repeat protein
MRKVTCQSCRAEQPFSGFFRVNGTLLCEACANKSAADLESRSQPLEVTREIDPTICSQCQTDYGRTELPLVGGLPFCDNCRQAVYNRGFPAWLTASLAGLLVLLAVALWHGSAYFRAERSLILGERALGQGSYVQAAAYFEDVLKMSPKGQKGVLLSAKAYLLAGDVEKGQAAINRREKFEQDALFREVNALWSRTVSAFDKAERASNLQQERKWEEAAKVMREAATEYPQSAYLAVAADLYAGGAAFQRKDYDRFLEFTKAAMSRDSNDANTLATAASAFACKYAVTGNPEFRAQSEEMLDKAKALVTSPEAQEWYDEYAERIHHRLDSREIIERDEYNRRFRKSENKGKS